MKLLEAASQFSNSTLFLKWLEIEEAHGSEKLDQMIKKTCKFCDDPACNMNCESASRYCIENGIRFKPTKHLMENN